MGVSDEIRRGDHVEGEESGLDLWVARVDLGPVFGLSGRWTRAGGWGNSSAGGGVRHCCLVPGTNI